MNRCEEGLASECDHKRYRVSFVLLLQVWVVVDQGSWWHQTWTTKQKHPWPKMVIWLLHANKQNSSKARRGKKTIRVYLGARLLDLNLRCSYSDAKVEQAGGFLHRKRETTASCSGKSGRMITMDATLPNTDLKGNLKPLAGLPLRREQLQQLDPQLVWQKKRGTVTQHCHPLPRHKPAVLSDRMNGRSFDHLAQKRGLMFI